MRPDSDSDLADLRIEVVRTAKGLDVHAEAWDRLAASLPQTLPMATHAWVRTLLEVEATPDERLVCLFAYAGDDLVGVLPGVTADVRVLGRRLTRVTTPCHYHVSSGDLALDPSRAAEALPLLLARLRREVPRFAGLELEAVREVSPTWGALDTVRGFAVAVEDTVQGSSFPIRGDAAAWFGGLSKNLRSDLKRSANRMRKDGLGEVVVSFQAGDEADPADIEAFLEVEASGWKGDDGTAVLSDASTTQKYRTAARRFADHGLLEWHRMEVGGRLAAMNMVVRLGPRIMLLRQGLAGDFTRYGAGNHLLRAAVEREFELDEGRGEGELNLVTDYPWCRRWRMELSWYRRVRFVARGPLAWAREALPIRARNLLRRVPGLREWVRRRRSRAD